MPTNTISEPARCYSQPEATLWDVVGASSPAGKPPASKLLSSAQISTPPLGPRLSWARNGNLVQIKLPGPPPKTRGNRRACTDFTNRSRLGLLRLINSLDRGHLILGCGRFVTLTFPDPWPGPRDAKKLLKRILQRYERAWDRRWVIWKLEPQPQRGAPHFHLLYFAASQDTVQQEVEWWANAWHDIAGQGNPDHLRVHLGTAGGNNRPCVEQVRDWNGVSTYAGKYMGKLVGGDAWDHPGRWWGCTRRDELPIIIDEADVDDEQAKLVRRQLVRYYEHQKSGRCRLTYPRERGPAVVNRGWYNKAFVVDAIESGVGVMFYNRRWPSSRGGCTIFMPEAQLMRILAWSAKEADRRSGGGRAGSGSSPPPPAPCFPGVFKQYNGTEYS